jgi:glycosyltransferase involved in cell wall biosynthesis
MATPATPPRGPGALRIGMLSKSDLTGGGASRVAQQMAVQLRAAGHEIVHLVGYKAPTTRDPMQLVQQYPGWTWFNDQFRDLSAWAGVPEFYSLGDRILRRRAPDIDVLHVHDISGAFSPRGLARLCREVPVVWTFHDCSSFTGGCIYPYDCERFRTTCGDCPQMGRWPLTSRFDRTGAMHRFKRTFANDFVAVAPSRWMRDMAMASGLYRTAPFVIPYSVDTAVFNPIDKRACREALGMPQDRPVLCCCANFLWEKRKGAIYFVQAMRQLAEMRPYLVLIGNEDPALRKMLKGFDCRFTGFISDYRWLAVQFAAADLLIAPTLADNLPCTIMEAMAVGTPSVAFSSGGVPDLIDHDDNGWLAKPASVDELLAGIRHALDDRAILERWRARGIERMHEHHTPELINERYLELYRQTIAQFKAHTP